MVSAIQILGLAGMITAYYAYHVESKLHDPFYKPVCETSWGSCATKLVFEPAPDIGTNGPHQVFRSSYAHLVSHFGIVPEGHPLDLSLAESGMMIYAIYCLYPTFLFKRFVPYPKHVLLLMSCAGCIMSFYLLYVLKFVLQDFCIVCTTFHAINFSMFFFVTREFRKAAPEAASNTKTD